MSGLKQAWETSLHQKDGHEPRSTGGAEATPSAVRKTIPTSATMCFRLFSSRIPTAKLVVSLYAHGSLVAQVNVVAICCYRFRAVAFNRCEECKPAYGCLTFGSIEELAHFDRLIPPSMVGAPLPLNLWPNLWKAIDPEAPGKGKRRVSPVEVLARALVPDKNFGRDR